MLACLLVAVLAACAAAAPRDILVLHLLPPPPQADLLAIQVCCGLFNRAPSPSRCYTVSSASDIDWLTIVAPSLPSPPPFTPLPVFMRACFSECVKLGRGKERVKSGIRG